MVANRRWPKPPDGAIHLIGDTHFGSTSMTANRKALWAADQRVHNPLLPDTVLHVIVGDFVDHGLTSEDHEATTWMNTQVGVGNWISAVGNHDIPGNRTPDQAAQSWGMPAASFVYDLGFARIIVIAPDDGIENDGWSMKPFSASRLNWVNARCVEAGPDMPCFIVCHWSLADTVGPTAGATISSYSDGYSAEVDADIRTMLADNPNTKAWLSGHTHSPLAAPDLVTSVTVGGHQLAAINASAPCYTGDVGNNLTSQQATLYLTVTDGYIDVRFRDHGAGIWTVAGPANQQVWQAAL